MSSALTGNQIKDSYQALLKIGTNGSLDPTTPIAISDGLGNDTPLQLAGDKLLTNYLGNDIGLRLDFLNNTYEFGDFNCINSGTSFFIDSLNSLMYTKHNGQREGLFFDFVNNYYQIGDFLSTNNATYMTIDDDNQFIRTYGNGNSKGLNFDFVNSIYYLGDWDGVNQNTYLKVDDSAQNINLHTSNGDVIFDYGSITFNGPKQVGNTGDPNEFLNIVVNGTPYVIKLYNP